MTGWSICWRPSLSLRHSGLEPESSQPKSSGRKASLVAQTRVGWIPAQGRNEVPEAVDDIDNIFTSRHGQEPAEKMGGKMTRRQSKRRRIRA
ncbi:hypothetical protein SZ54_2462 [Rhizobium sp. UR51a]|jgi:hypothetical protein|nr:hypothetical protein SZ54_2462 [Rhizobium sp. UR51a]